ncbi:MAG: 4-alpha-glucanotransferase [Calditrichaceae bacterium]|nr:4-alpha-glucanotransferase [Calditrichia bacterium]NUQ42560.1 4-alpha-glucanotransferase [Calditrichaceae bacterium]
MTQLTRSSGLLLHPTSLPGPYGIGEIGEAALRWIDFLANARQSVWQILPLGPTGYGNSPYQTTSVFAGNPLLIDLAELAKEDYISPAELAAAPAFPEHYVEFERVIEWKIPLLMRAYRRFADRADERKKEEFQAFCRRHDPLWLEDFALFMALKEHFKGGSWNTWPEPLKLRQAGVLAEMKEQLGEKILAHKFLQYQFFKQWGALRRYANEKGILILGDIPIYVTYDSAEVWATQEKFLLDKEGNPIVVAGVPPDYFSETGQLWGNPIYNWELMEKEGFRWWIDRVRVTLECVDLARIDHFRGFEAYWAVPFTEKTAVNGKWIKGPDRALFDALTRALGDIPVVAEDLGLITPEVEALRDRYGFPGMKILQFAFGGDPDAPYLPHNFERNCLVYTGSHDNDTTRGWFETAPPHEREFCLKYIGATRESIPWEFIRLATASVALLAVFPLQDVLDLGSEARMNVPGKPSGNWGWRYQAGQLQDWHAARLADLAHLFGRAPRGKQGEFQQALGK